MFSRTYNKIRNLGFEQLCSILPDTFIKKLHLWGCEITCLESMINVLPKTKIEELNLNWNNFGDQEFHKLCDGLIDSNVWKLEVKGCKLTRIPSSMAHTKIKYLNISSNKLGNEGFEEFCNILPQTSITWLNITNIGITTIIPLIQIISETKLCGAQNVIYEDDDASGGNGIDNLTNMQEFKLLIKELKKKVINLKLFFYGFCVFFGFDFKEKKNSVQNLKSTITP